jgi:hypothetical protein
MVNENDLFNDIESQMDLLHKGLKLPAHPLTVTDHFDGVVVHTIYDSGKKCYRLVIFEEGRGVTLKYTRKGVRVPMGSYVDGGK